MKIPSIGLTQYKNYLFHKYLHGNKINKNAKIGNRVELINSIIEDFASIKHHASVRNSKIGRYSSIGRYTKITHTDINAFCAISWDSTINAVQHPLSHLTVHAFPYISEYGCKDNREERYRKVTIMNDVWIGANSVILPGLKIGNGAVIAANTLVTRNVPDYAVVAGVPSKILRYRFRKEIIEKLLELQWWNLDFEAIKQNIEIFQNEFKFEDLDKLEEIVRGKT